MKKIHCTKCGKVCMSKGVLHGYVIMPITGAILCYSCCDESDKQRLLNANPGDKFYMYLTGNIQHGYYVSNWPGSFKIRVSPRKGHHNIAGVRYDFWFTFGNNAFHGVQYGDNTQVAHIRCLKNK